MPLYCFLLAEGFRHSRSRRQYWLRLLILAFVSEYPFDMMAYGHMTSHGQNVIFTLLFAFTAMLALDAVKKLHPAADFFLSLGIVLLTFFAAELCSTDYGGYGVLFVLLFYWSENWPERILWQTLGLFVLTWYCGGRPIALGSFSFPIEVLGTAAMLPIALYSGEKRNRNPLLKWSFSLFYPVHMLCVALLFS